MSWRSDGRRGDRGLGLVLLAASGILFAVYADGQAGHTFRFLAELLVELAR